MLINSKKKVHDAIRHKLLVGELQPGARLSELSLAKEMGVSRTPVREALNQLTRDGLLESQPHMGTYVRILDRDELAELFDLREMLEAYAARRAATRINEVQLDELRKNCLLMEAINQNIIRANLQELKGTLGLRWKVCDVAFHSSLIAASDSPRINRIIRDFHILTNLCLRSPRDKSIKLHDNIARVLRDHCEIVDALERRNPSKSASRMSAHIKEGKRQTLASYDHDHTSDSSTTQVSDLAIERILGY